MRDISDYTQHYLKPSFEDYQIVYRRKKIMESMQKHPHMHILEIGCGMEPLFKFMDNDYESYTVVEPSRQFYENVCREAGNNPRVTCFNMCFTPSDEIRKTPYDFIVLSGLLHELEEPYQMLKDIYAVANEDTVIHINVPNANSFHRILAKEMGLIKDLHDFSDRNIVYQQHTVYDIDTLTGAVEENGFRVLEKGSYFVKPFSHAQMYEMMKAGIIDETVLDGLYHLEKYLNGLGSEIFVNIQKG